MTKSKAPLAMMEQMVMLVVFALAAALCLVAPGLLGLTRRELRELAVRLRSALCRRRGG